MSQPVLYIAITSHGFGHTVRASSVAAAIKKLCPDLLLILVTAAPRWLLDTYIQADFIHRPRSFDIGVIQSDSLTMDKDATLEKLRQIRSRQQAIVAGEVSFIQQNKVSMILGDIPFLAAEIAAAAGIPCWMSSNFGWDFIYRDWGGEFVEIADWISECYARCDRLFRLPFHEPMTAFQNIADVGLTGGTPRYNIEELRDEFNINTPPEKTILLTFGGLSLQAIPYAVLTEFTEWQFITFDREAPALPNLLKIADRNYRPVDFMPACGRVISKPGYSTFAEALKLEIPIVSIVREGFAEAPLLLEGIANYSSHQIIATDEFFSGNWEFLRLNPQPPRRGSKLDKNGSEAIARAVVNYLIS